MAYIPKDAEWYIAELINECRIESESDNVVHIDIVLINATSPEEAFQKANELGKENEISYLNPKNQEVTWFYRGLRDLNVVHDELEHGAELLFEEEIGMTEDEVEKIISDREQLNVFAKIKSREKNEPDYSCKEIIDKLNEIIND